MVKVPLTVYVENEPKKKAMLIIREKMNTTVSALVTEMLEEIVRDNKKRRKYEK